MFKKISVFAVTTLFSILASGRWMNPEEADVSILERSKKVYVNANGSFNVEVSQTLKILTEKGRSDWGTTRFSYSPKNTKFNVISAFSNFNGVKTKVKDSEIVDSLVSAKESGFDDVRQIIVSFSKVVVGSEITFVTKQETFKAFIENQFSDRDFFGDYNLQLKGDVDFISERQLHLQINDPVNALEVKSAKKGNRFIYKFTLKEPVIFRVLGETKAFVPDEKLVWFVVSTAKTIPEKYEKIAERYKKNFLNKLPLSFLPIVESAKKIKDPIELSNFVLSAVSEKIRYMGDWRPVDGANIPRSFEEIVSTQFGDCKDLSMLTAKILREAGLNADVAFIQRGYTAYSLPKIGHEVFNHAIVTVASEGRRFWLDPTNFQSFAQGVFEDIAGRGALILKDQPELAWVDFTPYSENQEVWDWKLAVLANGTRKDVVSVKQTGVFAINDTGIELKISKQRFEAQKVGLGSDLGRLNYFLFQPYNLKSRIVKPIELNYTTEKKNLPLETSMGPAIGFEVLGGIQDIVELSTAGRESDFILGVPRIIDFQVSLENIKPIGMNLKSCSVFSEWFDYSFDILREQKQINRKLTIKKYFITANQILTEEFKKMQLDLEKCSRSRYFVYQML